MLLKDGPLSELYHFYYIDSYNYTNMEYWILKNIKDSQFFSDSIHTYCIHNAFD